jgi:hypothetical protein
MDLFTRCTDSCPCCWLLCFGTLVVTSTQRDDKRQRHLYYADMWSDLVAAILTELAGSHEDAGVWAWCKDLGGECV